MSQLLTRILGRRGWMVMGIFLGSLTLVQAQSKRVLSAYAQGKERFKQAQYMDARTAFQEVVRSGEENQFVESAYFYIAFSYYKNKELAQAQVDLQRFIERYPGSNHIEEAYYMLADIAWQEQDYEGAFQHSNAIYEPKLKREAFIMKGHYLSEMELSALKLLQKSRPQDTLVAQVLVDKLAATSDNLDDLYFIQDLIEKMQLEEPLQQKIKQVIYKREPYKVAVILPFDIEKLVKNENGNLSKISVQMYQGMRMAQKELDSTSGPKLQLYAYDLRKNQDTLNKWILEEEFKDIDFMVGPIYDNVFTQMADLAAIEQFNIINPLSDKPELLINPFAYLYYPTIATQARKSAEFIHENYTNKNTIIFNDNLSKNRILARNFRDKAESLGMKALVYEEISTYQASRIGTILDTHASSDIGSIMVASTSQLIASEVLEFVDKRNLNVPILVPEAWSKFQSIDNEDFERLNVHFIHKDYLDEEDQTVADFAQAYEEFAYEKPNEYAYIGYEIIHFFAEILKDAGTDTDFRAQLRSKGLKSGRVYGARDYAEGNDNQFVPIIRINKGLKELVIDIK